MKKLKILYVVPVEASIPGSDLGGVIPSSEQFMQGFRELGHEATFVRLRDTSQTGRYDVPSRSIYGPDQWIEGPGTGLRMHTVLGWQGHYYTTGNGRSLQEFIDLANAHDVVVWGALFGFKNKYTAGQTNWFRVFTDVRTPTVVMIRDDHLWERQAWTSMVEPYINGWAPVHSCGFDLSAGLTKPRGIVFSTHDIGGIPTKTISYRQRMNEVLMVQNFKSWKRSERLVMAVPHMESNVTLAGNGIELRYMMAEEKCKPRYFATKRNDPDIVEFPDMEGKRIWENAEACPNFRYLGAVTEAQRDGLMQRAKFLTDLSERHNTGMFNRVFIEAARQGQVTLALDMFMSGVDGDNPLWQPGVHYLPVEPYSKPKKLGQQIDGYMKIGQKKYDSIIEAVHERLPMFDRKVGSQQLIDLALGKRPKNCWAYDRGGSGDVTLLAKGKAEFESLFGRIA